MARFSQPRVDIAAEITNLIITKLEAGVPPWSRPWNGSNAGGRPLRHEGTPYTGINALYLWAIADAAGYNSPYWMTYKQAGELGGQVRRGEKGSFSVYFSSFTKTETNAAGKETDRHIRFLRHYIVFNADQIEGLPSYFYPDKEPAKPVKRSAHSAAIDKFFSTIPAEVIHGGNEAYYRPSNDTIQLPQRHSFITEDHYAATRAHETVHWSGAAHRLARTFGRRFGDHAYSFEEMVAEIGSGMVCADLGLPNTLHDSHASYVGHWLKILRGDKTAIFTAAAKAEQAFNYLRSFSMPVVGQDQKDEEISPEALKHAI